MQVKNLSRFTNLSLRRVFNVLIILLVVAVTAQVVKAASAFEQVADIIPGADGSSPGHLAVYNGELYFSAYDVTNGTELWKYDGTSVSMVENINTVGTNGSNPSYMTVYDGKLFFRADDGVNGVELWKYDGTAASLAVDINSGLNDSSPSYLTVYDGLLYFAANDGISGLELWKYNGTSASLAIDIVSGPTGSWPEYLAVYDNALYFRADGGDGKGTELWKYDGSSASLAADIASVSGDSSFPSSLAVYNGALYFSANDRTDVAGKELWKYDGSSASLAADIVVGSNDSSPEFLTVYNGALYFSAEDPTTGTEMWKYDGTSATLVADTVTGSDGSYPGGMTEFNGALYFSAEDGITGAELWKYDGASPTVSAHSLQSTYEGMGPGTFTVDFSEDVNNPAGNADADDVTNPANFLLINKGANKVVDTLSCLGGVKVDDSKVLGSSVSYANPTATVTLLAPLPVGAYRLFVCGTTSIVDLAGNPLGNGTDFSFDFSVDITDQTPPTVSVHSLQPNYTLTGPSTFTVTFSEDVNNPAGNTGSDDVTNPANFLLIEKGANQVVDTLSCAGGVKTDDSKVLGSSVSYANPTATVTLAAPLPVGEYRLFVCGTTSIVDLAGNPLENGTDFSFDFSVDITDQTPPTVSAHSLQPNYTLTGPSTFTVTFSEDVNNPAGNTGSDDVTNPANFLLINKGANKVVDTLSCLGGVKVDDSKVSGSSVSYANPTATVTLLAPLPVGAYRLFVCGTTSIVDLAGNTLSNGTDFSFDFSVDLTDHIPPAVSTISLKSNYTGSGPTIFTVSFSEDVYNPEGDTDSDDVTNPANFLLIEKGVNQVVDTISCLVGVKTDDSKVSGARVSYANRIATVTLAEALPAGNYRLFICGTTSIVDLHGNTLNNGVDITFNFAVTKGSVKSLPKTGFAPNRVTVLPAQASGAAYTKLSGLWLDIPSQKLQVSIVGVPQLNDQWDVSWLGSSAGWLAGTAFPTWVGNSVITAHVTHANGQPGPFANLKNLVYGEQIVVHLYGAKYTYEVRDSRQVSPDTTSYALEHLPDYSYLTLITCQNYDFLTDAYTYRRVVRAVLVSIGEE